MRLSTVWSLVFGHQGQGFRVWDLGCTCRFLLAESRETGSTIIYSTHVFDGLENWPTHILYLCKGSVVSFSSVKDIPEYIHPESSAYTPNPEP